MVNLSSCFQAYEAFRLEFHLNAGSEVLQKRFAVPGSVEWNAFLELPTAIGRDGSGKYFRLVKMTEKTLFEAVGSVKDQ